jgi:hypothetical protein
MKQLNLIDISKVLNWIGPNDPGVVPTAGERAENAGSAVATDFADPGGLCGQSRDRKAAMTAALKTVNGDRLNPKRYEKIDDAADTLSAVAS